MEFRLFLFRSPPAVVVRPITSTYISSVSVLSRAIDGSTKKISTHFCTSTPLTCPATPSAAQLMTASAVTLRSASAGRSEEHASELQSLMRISYAVFCLKHKKTTHKHNN